MQFLGFVIMPGDGGLSVIGKDLDHVLVDEDAQGEVFAFLQFERRLSVAEIECFSALTR